MLHYMMTPLDQHSDDGLGATGEAFEEAAELLLNAPSEKRVAHVHIPVCYLYRHSVELFLKSMIVVLHRSLKIPYGTRPPDGPGFVESDGQWKPFHRVHSVATLWDEFKKLVKDHEQRIMARCQTEWAAFPEEVERAIDLIEKADASSTFFRYTDPRSPEGDAAKSDWKEKGAAEILAEMGPSGKYVKAFLLVGPDEQIVRAYQYDDSPMSGLVETLRDTAHTLSGAHTGLRVELAGGT